MSFLRAFPISLCALVLAATSTSVQAQTTGANKSVQLWAQVQSVPPRITLNWTTLTNITGYQIFRKLKGGTSWGAAVADPSATDLSWVDNNVALNTSYEYKIIRSTANLGAGYGYVNAGIEVAMVEARGKMILLVDNTMSAALATQLVQLQSDLEGDGWKVLRHDVDRNAAPPAIKSYVITDYNADPANVKAVFIVGHVPVPYSGALAPDGHGDHVGAWSADTYYADVNGVWSDAGTVATGTLDPRNVNLVGDGKFDQSTIPSAVELAVGRVDFANLPAFSQSESALLLNYLVKLHNWKVQAITAQVRAVVDDNFDGYADAFSYNAWRGFAPLVNPANMAAGDYFTSMTGQSYLWSYACGGGYWAQANGVGTTAQFATSNLQSIFTILFGSYFGDFDCPDNFMRASLASGNTLTCFWAGYPNWYFHHMGMGETIGYATTLSENNANGHYEPANPSAGRVHMALLGDPSLRMTMMRPPSNVNGTQVTSTTANITWTASPDVVLGYHVYRYDNGTQSWIRRTTNAVNGTSYVDDITGQSGTVRYMVRALRLESTPSGTYYNLSIGAFGQLVLVGSNTDCLGVVNGTALPGTACNDGNANTGNDTWTSNCVCVGVPFDCLGVLGGSALPGTVCNDGNACTTSDHWSNACVCTGTAMVCNDNNACTTDACVNGTCVFTPGPDTDGDGVCNALDNCPNVAGQIGSPCSDGNACTINDALNSACQCVGTLSGDTDGDGICNAQDNCPNVPGVIGSNCNDGNACTVNDVLNASCVCTGTVVNDSDGDGICDAQDNCPNVFGVIGSSCNDGNACTVNDVLNASCQCAGTQSGDTDGDGICNAQDNCPNVSGVIGSNCDDGNACTINDVLNASCQCVGSPGPDTDSDGICNAVDNCPNVAGVIGSACNDGNPCTINDVLNASCQCSGTSSGDTDGDGICNAQDNCPNVPGVIGSSCNDNNPCTTNDVLNASCQCAGTPSGDIDGDGICNALDNCPNVPGVIGSSCNDGNTNTINDALNASCQCVGTLVNLDCNGVPNGPDLPGTPCDDGNSETGNDTWTATCECLGEAFDCLGVPGGSAVYDACGVCNGTNACLNGATTVCTVVGALDGDAEEAQNGDIYANSGAIDLVHDGEPGGWRGDQRIGLRFPGIAIPQGAQVVSAYIQFTSRPSADTDPCNLQIAVQNIANAPPIGYTPFSISSRTYTGNIAWQPAPWPTNDLAGLAQRTPDLTSAVQQVISLGGWQSGNALLVRINGIGRRAAWSADQDQQRAAVLCISYQTGTSVQYDCQGVLGGSATIGSACDDGSSNTINDTWTVNCQCIGEGIDCNGVANGPAMPGTPCDDGDPTTGNDLWSVACACAGLPYDCAGTPGGSAVMGTACNDNNANTINDTWGLDCVCAGDVIDCLGVTDGTALPGTACDDGDATTGADTWTTNCQCLGLPIDCNGVPGGGAEIDLCGVCGGTNDCIDATVCAAVGPSSNPDAEEATNGLMFTNTGSLDLVYDSSPTHWRGNQVVGLRFDSVDVPQGVTIVSAYVQFTARGTTNVDPCLLQIAAQATGNAPPIGGSQFNLSSRTPTTAVPWSPPHWNIANESGIAQRTPNIASSIQEVVAQPGWQQHNALMILILGTGGRSSWSWDMDPTRSARLCISYSLIGSPLLDCQGVVNGPAQPGTACDDGDITTGNDTWSSNCVCAGQALDCTGTPGGSSLPGTACDDGNAGTGDDTWNTGCVCAGLQIDCVGIIGGPALPGSACDDGDMTTGNDTWSNTCICAGLFIDCVGEPGGTALVGTACDDGNSSTGADTWNAGCVCAGLFIDCVGIPGGSALPGGACDDGNSATGDDTWNANCVCAGLFIDCVGTPGGTSVPGTACDDGDANTGNDTWNNTCVCAGLLIDCVGTPGGTSLPGSACDDGNTSTGDDTWNNNCVCSGLLIDCMGTPGGTALPGSTCDDGDNATGDDTWSNNCVCAGLLIDCVGIPGGSTLPGTACDDGDATTGNDTWSNACVCAGLLIDCTGVPGGTALPGASCDDGNANTGADAWTGTCICIGLPYDCLGVPGGVATPGSTCDDGDTTTGNDTWNASCQCIGLLIDCAGVPGGSAFIDSCSTCAGGTTGVSPNPDQDGDGAFDCADNCPSLSNAAQADFDLDGVGDLCDNCPWVFNPSQADGNTNGVGDACDVGIDEIAGAPVLALQPNPTTGLVRIAWNDPQAREIICFDVAGAAVRSFSFAQLIDVSALAQGTYVLVVHDAEGRALARARLVRE